MLQTYTWSTGDYAYQSWSNGYKIHLTLTEESISEANNTSLVSYVFAISNGGNNRFYSNGYNWNISIGGQTIAIKNFNFYVYPYNVTQTIASGKITVKHNSDGTLHMPFSVSIPNLKADNQYAPPAMSIASTWALTEIHSAPPIITASVVDTNATTIALTGDNRKLIKYFSNAYASMTVEAQNGATIDQDLYIIRNSGDVGYGTSHTFEKIESNYFSFSAADNWGNVGGATVTPTMVNYVKLTCNMTSKRPDASGNMDVQCTGSFFNGSFGAVENALTVQCRYMKQGGTYSDWFTMTIVENGNYYGAYTSFTIPDFDYQAVYVFECKATDKLSTVTSTPDSAKSMPAFHWSENDFVFEVPVTFNAGTNDSSTGDKEIDGNLHVTGDLRLKGDGNYGNTLRFGDGDYCFIQEPEDDEMLIKAGRIDLVANGVYIYGNPIPDIQTGVWTPELNASAVSYYTTQYGWFSKMGQTVSVGFYIKANCYSSYQNDHIEISGLPFTPMFASGGGGICSGAYVNGGWTFQCFVAETTGYITTRVQACNNTSSANLSTSASGCFYPYNGGTLTLSGTITYRSNS